MPALGKETISGVPIGLSRDYDDLPQAGPFREVRCQICNRFYEDALRLMPDGARILAVMCLSCREQGRARWIAEKRVDPPQAFGRLRKTSHAWEGVKRVHSWWKMLFKGIRWKGFARGYAGTAVHTRCWGTFMKKMVRIWAGAEACSARGASVKPSTEIAGPR